MLWHKLLKLTQMRKETREVNAQKPMFVRVSVLINYGRLRLARCCAVCAVDPAACDHLHFNTSIWKNKTHLILRLVYVADDKSRPKSCR